MPMVSEDVMRAVPGTRVLQSGIWTAGLGVLFVCFSSLGFLHPAHLSVLDVS